MGGSEAIGVLLPSGEVRYYLVSGGTVGLSDIWKNTKEQCLVMCEETTTLSEYFSYTLFEEEDSVTRYLMITDDEILYRYYGGHEEYIAIRRKL